ncbi:hypothetical protein ACFWWC_41800 [Streptomyces sp. NPDC058642]|uniref:hypothetical protein n=1 Tax=Streptomyces sp. NPDC058642 TaxID=3346572 RepID=UPI00365F15B7
MTGSWGMPSAALELLRAPTTALLGRYDESGRLRYTGRTTTLGAAVRDPGSGRRPLTSTRRHLRAVRQQAQLQRQQDHRDGRISGCTGTPDACANEVDLEVYLSGPGWVTAASTYSYRTATLGTIVHDGTDSNTATSAVLNVKCL